MFLQVLWEIGGYLPPRSSLLSLGKGIMSSSDEDFGDEDFMPGSEFVLQPRVSQSRGRQPQKGKAAAADASSSKPRKSAAKRKKATDTGSDEEADPEIIPDVIPAANMKTCALKLWTKLRQLNPYRFPTPPFSDDPRFWTRIGRAHV